MTTSWRDRPPEQTRLLNPAFLGVLLWSFAKGYQQNKSEGLPYVLTFLAIPIILHRTTRSKLPRTTRTSLPTWLNKNPDVNIQFVERLASLQPFVKESLIFALNAQILNFSNGRILSDGKPRSMNSFLDGASEEVNHCIKKAEFLGKWFSLSGEAATIMALWGVKP